MKLNNDEVLESPSKKIYHKYNLEFKLNVKWISLHYYLPNGEHFFTHSKLFIYSATIIPWRKLLISRTFWVRQLFKGDNYLRKYGTYFDNFVFFLKNVTLSSMEVQIHNFDPSIRVLSHIGASYRTLIWNTLLSKFVAVWNKDLQFGIFPLQITYLLTYYSF